MVAPVVGGLDKARALSHEEFLYWLEIADHRLAVEQLSEQLHGLMSNTPSESNDDKSQELRIRHGIDSIRVQCALICEDCCFHLPLDHEFGEQYDPPEAEHWWDAPGVNGG
jgi:hypothetical protein